MSKLTRSEKNAIIINESKGIQHPDYYVCYTKKGGVQVRKRKTPLVVTEVENTPGNVPGNKTAKTPDTITEDKVEKIDDTKPNVDYESVSNKQLLEKMLSILEKNVECKDKSLNDPEKERVTEENKQYVEGVKKEVEKPVMTHSGPRPSVLQGSEAIKQTQKPIISQRRKGRNLLC